MQDKMLADMLLTIPDLVPLGKEFLVPGIWHEADHAARIRRMQQFADAVTEKMGKRPVTVEYEPSDMTRIACGGGYYIPLRQIIAIASTRSVMTFLHEFGHHLFLDASEDKVAHWSHDLFRALAPRTYRKALERGGFFSTTLLDEEEGDD